ncbi:MAG: hypothetical protein ABH885_00055 [Candidatus Omnitrophota bacterium]
MIWFFMLLWALSAFGIGLAVLMVIDRHGRIRGPEALGLSFLTGVGLISVHLSAAGLLGMKFTRCLILVPWAAVFVISFFISKAPLRERLGARFTAPGRSEIIFVCLILFEVLYTLWRAVLKPMESYDSVAIYALKGKILYLAGAVPGNFFGFIANHFHGIHPDYPLFISMAETWVYVFTGAFNDFASKLIFPLAFAAFLAVFFSVLRRVIGSRRNALIFTFMLGSVAQFNNYAVIGCADMHMGIHFSLSLLYLYLWMREKNCPVFIFVSLIFGVFSLWTKNEGLVLADIVLAVLLVYTARNFRGIDLRGAACIILYSAVIGAAAAAWMIFRSGHGLVNENLNPSMLTAGNLFKGLGRMPMILYEYQKHVFGFKKWNIIWILVLAAAVKCGRSCVRGDRLYITLAMALFFASYTAVYVFSAVEIDFLLRTTASRFLIHILPVSVFWVAGIWSDSCVPKNTAAF